MTVPLGETIRTLRQRDGRTQEALASAIGVTSQAVSRWESNGGYPDVEIIPAIANYFHVTIDTLFGYVAERETIIQGILQEADSVIKGGYVSVQALEAIEAAGSEFPADGRIQMRRGIMYMILGFQRHGARSTKPSEEDDGQNIASYNRQNQDFVTALAIFERVLPELSEPEDRSIILGHMVRLYSIRGEYEKAEALVQKQASLSVSREVLLPSTAVGEKRKRYQGELLLALAWRMTNTVMAQVTFRHDLRSNHTGIDKALQIVALYHSICDDGNLGFGHYALKELFHLCCRTACELDLDKEATAYAQHWHEHHQAYELLKKRGALFCYTAPLVQGVTEAVDTMPPIKTWGETVAQQPEKLRRLLERESALMK